MKQITNLLLCIVINIGLIWCDIEHLMKQEPIIYLPYSDVTLHCPDTITNSRKASFRWTLNGRSLKSYVNETNAIQIQMQPDFRGVFICYATQEIDGQDLTKISSLNIDTARIQDWEIVKDVPMYNVYKGDPLILTCDNMPHSVPVGQYSWYKQDASEAQVKESHRVAIDQKGTLYFVYIEMGDNFKGDEYKCSVSNRMLGEIRLGSPKRFYVKESKVEDKAPSLLYNGTGDYTVIGRSAVLECIFSGLPAPDISWYDKESKLIISNGKYKIEKWGRMLTINDVDESDEGYYRCTGENIIDRSESTVFLNVSSKPIFLNNHDKSMKVINNTMEISCATRSAAGESPPNPPVWIENGEYLSQDKLDHGKYELKRDGMVLHVYNLTQPDDYRCFQCIVSNSVGVNYVTSCFTSNSTSIDVQEFTPQVVQTELINPLPKSVGPSDVVSQINLGLLLGVIFGVMMLFLIAGIASLVIFRKRRKKANQVPQTNFYAVVNQGESGFDNNK